MRSLQTYSRKLIIGAWPQMIKWPISLLVGMRTSGFLNAGFDIKAEEGPPPISCWISSSDSAILEAPK